MRGFGFVFRLCATASDEIAFRGAEFQVFAGIAVEGVEEDKVKKADDASNGKAPAPSDVQEHDADERNADARSEFCGRVEHGGGEAAFLGRKPVAGGFGVGGKGGSFADPEEESRGEEAAYASSGGCREGGNAPDKSADAANKADAKTIKDQAGRELEGGIGPIVGAGEIAEHDGGHAEGFGEGLLGNGEVDAIEIVNQDAEAKEEGDAPTPARDGWIEEG